MKDTVDTEKFRIILFFYVIQTIFALTLVSANMGGYFLKIIFQNRILF